MDQVGPDGSGVSCDACNKQMTSSRAKIFHCDGHHDYGGADDTEDKAAKEDKEEDDGFDLCTQCAQRPEHRKRVVSWDTAVVVAVAPSGSVSMWSVKEEVFSRKCDILDWMARDTVKLVALAPEDEDEREDEDADGEEEDASEAEAADRGSR